MNFPRFLIIRCYVTNSRDNNERLLLVKTVRYSRKLIATVLKKIWDLLRLEFIFQTCLSCFISRFLFFSFFQVLMRFLVYQPWIMWPLPWLRNTSILRWKQNCSIEYLKDDVTQGDWRFATRNISATRRSNVGSMLQLTQCHNIVATLYCTKNRCCKSSRVISP